VRSVLLVAAWAAVLGLGALEIMCWMGVSQPAPFDWLWAFTPYVFLPAWLLIVLAGVMGARALGLAAIVVAGGHLALLLPAMSGRPMTAPADATRLRVVTANVFMFNPDTTELLRELREADADVVVLQEVTNAALPAIRRGLDAAYPHHALMARNDAFGAAIFSTAPLRDGAVLDTAGLPMLAVTVRVGGVDVRVWDVHTRAPTALNRRQLRDEMLDAMATLRPKEHLPLVVAGDYNATIWHRPMRTVMNTGLDDAAGAVGKGLRGTWKSLRVVESPIDHVLVSPEISVLDVRVGTGEGSDHRPLIADLALTG
jgi:endonuclease/exonuclease/phosphatase (EEP) superfamily protein YafD